MEEITSIETTKKIALDVLVDIDKFCRENNIKYFLAYGTLIGAIRHNGFIPWDDDIDIMMPRPDYERFLQIYKSDKFEIINAGAKDYIYSFAKVYDKDTAIIEKTTVNKPVFGVYVDVFPLDGLPETEEEQRAFNDKTYKIKHLLSTKSTPIGRHKSVVKNALLIPVRIALAPFTYQNLSTKLNKLAQTYSYEASSHSASLVWNNKYNFYDKKWYEELIEHDFEGYSFLIPKHYDEMLRRVYGDYMQLPPENERVVVHGYKVFRK